MSKALFPTGMIVGTPGAIEALEEAGQSPMEFICRHVAGDWGDLTDADQQENERALLEGFRLLSAYTTTIGTTL